MKFSENTKSFLCICASLMAQMLGAAGSLGAPIMVAVSSPKDVIYDDSRQTMYVTSGASVVRYQVPTGQFLSSLTLNGGQATLIGLGLSADRNTLVVADSRSNASNNWIYSVDLTSNVASQIMFTKVPHEAGTFMTEYEPNGKILVTSDYGGSGNTPVREYDPSTGNTAVLDTLSQRAMVSPSADGSVLAMVGENASPAPMFRYTTATGVVDSTARIAAPLSEVAVNAHGTQFAVPTALGLYLFNDQLQQTNLTTGNSSDYPVSAVYAPTGNLIYTTWLNTLTSKEEFRVYSAINFQQVGATQLLPGTNVGVNNTAFVLGRERLSVDGSLLFVTYNGGVAIFGVPEPSSLVLAALGFVGLAAWGWRRRKQ